MKSDFSKGKIWRNIINQAIPLFLAQIVQLLYNIVDRIYIGHLPGIGSIALTGIGLTFPLTALVAAFTSLFATGGTPLFSMARGAKEEEKAEHILSQSAMLLAVSSIILFTACYVLRQPVLYLLGASKASYGYADTYLKIYLFGTTFSMLSTGLNGFINAQGFPRMGMLTVIIGAILNLILDPVFIFGFRLGIEGAATATVISQMVSAVWVLLFFRGRKALYRIRLCYLKPDITLIGKIISLGIAGFIMQVNNCLVQVTCNITFKNYGGDLYIGIMAVINSVREIFSLPVLSFANGAQPVLGYNYGAKQYGRVRQAIKFTSFIGFTYTIIAWLIILIFPHFWMSIFSTDEKMISVGAECLKIYFFGFCFMAFQFTAQSTFTALGCTKRAVFFSLLRKAIIVIPLTILLPRIGLGANGVFIAEPVSNLIGGLASFLTMWLTLYRKLPTDEMMP